MGWTYTYKAKGESYDSFFDREGLFRAAKDSGAEYRRLKSAAKDGVYYAATYYKDTEGKEKVFATVILMKRAPRDPQYNFGYKDMCDSMGPCEAKCPDAILDLLTPTDSQYGNEWRARCREYNAKKKALKAGAKIMLKEPMRFTDGAMRQSFTVESLRPLRLRADDGRLVGISNFASREYTMA